MKHLIKLICLSVLSCTLLFPVSGYSKTIEYGPLIENIVVPGRYSKEEAAQKLAPELKNLLDGVLRLYREPGLFTNRQAALGAIGVQEVNRKWWARLPDASRQPFTDYFSNKGFFARPGWRGHYRYVGWVKFTQKWHVVIWIKIDPAQECLDSRAVEGYLEAVHDLLFMIFFFDEKKVSE